MTAIRKCVPVDNSDGEGLIIGQKNSVREKYADLVETIGLTSPIGQRLVGKLYSMFLVNRDDITPWFELWHEHCDSYFDVPAAEEILAADVLADSGTRLFLAHTYCKIVLSELVHVAAPDFETAPARRSLYDWVDCISDRELTNLRAEFRRLVGETVRFADLNAVDCSDLLATVYQELLPPPLRHLLGEYYTPSWLVEYCVCHAENRRLQSAKTLTIMDPAAGSGSFLAHYITHLAS